MVVLLSPLLTRSQKTLFGPRFLLRRSQHSSWELARTINRHAWPGFTNFECQDSLSPVHPRASIQSSFQLYAGSAHGRGNLLTLDAVDHPMPANRVILAYGTAFPQAQHRVQIGSRQQRTMGVPRQSRRPAKASIPKRQIDLLQILLRRL
jgi:hypothetical protein